MQLQKNITSSLRIITSSFLTALVVNFLFMHDGLAPGGITGLALVLSSLFSIEVSTMSLLISVPLLIISTYVLGKGFGLKTLIIILLTPMFMNILPKIHVLQFLPQIPQWILSGIIGGVLIGVSIYLAIISDAATGGTDVMALLIQKKLENVKLEHIILALDGTIIISTALIHKELLLAVFSFMSLSIISKTLGTLLKNPVA